MQLVSEAIVLMDILESSKRRNLDKAPISKGTNLAISGSKQESVNLLKGILTSSAKDDEHVDKSRALNDLKVILSKKESPVASPESLSKLKSILNLSNVSKATGNSGTTSPTSSVSTGRSDSSDIHSVVETPVKKTRSKNSRSPAKSSPSISPTNSRKNDQRLSSSPNTSNRFASSRLLASPDPTSLPLPDFDENFFA